ncbi:MAG TPA: GMC family oxidoreductase N-terminal domain-containing protein, partial [Myxococcota bacterium]|nr:GMC family oxidoreductase N-terminal domain-containing protein [Myxococcota bacterium]
MPASTRLSRLAAALVPVAVDPHGLDGRAQRFLAHLPRPLRAGLGVALWGLVTGSGLVWRNPGRQAAGLVRMVEALLRSRWSLLHTAGLALKAMACLVVLGDVEARRALYARRRLALPTLPAPVAVVRLCGQPRLPVDDADTADFIVVGTGPAGATVARTLARAGLEVIVLEDGPPTPSTWAADSTLDVLTTRMRHAGLFTTRGTKPITILQGRGVGGSSVVNSAIAWRAPGDVLRAWHADGGLAQALTEARLDRAYSEVEAALGVEATGEAVLGSNSHLMAHAARAMGIGVAPTRRYTRGCEGLGRCLEGCPRGHKQGMNVSFVPDALAAGARLHPHSLVQRIDFEGRRAVGVTVGRGRRARRYRARRGVVVAASAIQTPVLLRGSGLPHPALGGRFQAHPGVSMAGVFDAPVRQQLGATQGLDSIHFRRDARIKLESLSLPDELIAARFPGVGPALVASLDELPHTALWVGLVRARAHGRVDGGLGWPRVTLPLVAQDKQGLGLALKTLGEMFFAAGARVVLPGVAGFPERVTDPRALAGLERGIEPGQAALVASHLFG